MIKAQFKSYGSYVTDSVYQWDLNQKLSISGLVMSSAPVIAYSSKAVKKAIIVQSKIVDGVINCDIPNALLQFDNDITAHLCSLENKQYKAVEKMIIPVIKRAMPADYLFTDNVPILTYEAIEADIQHYYNLSKSYTDNAKSEIDIERKRIDNLVKDTTDNVVEYKADNFLMSCKSDAQASTTETALNVFKNISSKSENLVNFITISSNSKIQIKKSGLYSFDCKVKVTGVNASTGRQYARLKINNVQKNEYMISLVGETDEEFTNFIISLNEGDTISFTGEADYDDTWITFYTTIHILDYDGKVKIPDITKEVSDIRIGVDNTVYDTAGQAVREQLKKKDNEISSIKEDISKKIEKPTTADNNKFPRAKDGGVEWVEQGLPTDAQTATAVQNWLNNHPEATTTVQDESLEESKFTLFLRQKKASYYKTVADMKKDISLKSGMVAVTLGYYEVNDGGGATYIIDEKEINKCKININLDNNLFANIILKDKIINVLNAGVKNDGKTPVSDRINELLKNLEYNKLYFPSGVYLLDKKILCHGPNDVSLVGESYQSENYYTDGSRNNTIFTISDDYSDNCIIDIRDYIRASIEGICFYGNSYKIACDDNISTTGNLHNMYTETILKEGISGIIVNGTQSFVSNCFFEGFSDNGINARQYNNIYNCIFSNCRIAVQASFDNTICNIICMLCGTGIMLGAKSEYENTSLNDDFGGVNTVHNIRVDGMSKHGIEVYGDSNIINTYISDQVNYASILLGSSSNIITNASLSRSAQYSAGNKMPIDANDMQKYCALYMPYDCANNYCEFVLKFMPANDLNKKDSITPAYAICSKEYTYSNVVNIMMHADDVKTINELVHASKESNMIVYVCGKKYELSNYLNNDQYIYENLSKTRNIQLRTGLFYDEGESTFIYSKAKKSWIRID